MKTQNQMEIEQLALAAELARQMAHDCGNFFFQLLLQLDLWETGHSTPQPGDWQRLRQDGQHLASLIRQWNTFQSQRVEGEDRVDLQRLLDDLGDDLLERDRPIEIAASPPGDALWVQGNALALRHLLRVAAEDLYLCCIRSATPPVSFSITAKAAEDIAIVTLSARGTTAGTAGTSKEEAESLLQRTCRSLAVRVGGRIIRHPVAEGRLTTDIELPLAPPSTDC